MDLLDEHLWAQKQLLRNVQQQFGAMISNSGNCDALANEIAQVTKVRLSNSSLRRVFGLVPYPHSPTAHMLNTLAQYVGHTNYKAFCDWLFHKEGIQIRITNYWDGWKVSRLLGNALRTDPEAQAILYPILAQTEGYFKNWMEIDHLCLCHYKGLQHYLSHHSGPDALCLGHGWLALAGLLNPEAEDWQQHAKALAPLVALWQAHGTISIVHPFMAGRALGAHFARCYATEASTDALWQFVLQESRAAPQVQDKWAAHPALAHAIAEVLLVAGHTLQAKELLAASLEAHAG